MNITYYTRKAQGLCPRCGSQPVQGKKHCKDCLMQAAQRMAKKHAAYKAGHRCEICGHALPEYEWLATCESCRKRASEWQKKKGGRK